MFSLSSEDREYFSKLNNKSVLNYNEGCPYDDYDFKSIKHFQD